MLIRFHDCAYRASSKGDAIAFCAIRLLRIQIQCLLQTFESNLLILARLLAGPTDGVLGEVASSLRASAPA
jgi:hypothetical protein